MKWLVLLLLGLTGCAEPTEDRIWYTYSDDGTTITAGKITFENVGYFEMTIVQSPSGTSSSSLATARCGTYIDSKNSARVHTNDGETLNFRTSNTFYFQPSSDFPSLLFDTTSANKAEIEALIKPVWGGC